MPKASPTPADPWGNTNPQVFDPKPSAEVVPARRLDNVSDADLGFGSLDDQDEHLNILYFGKEGTIKTTSALRMANFGKVALINAEGGAKASALRRQGIDTGNIRIYPDPKKGETLTFDGLEQLFYTMHAQLLNDPTAWAGVVFDSGTEITAMLKEQIVAEEVRKSPKRSRWFVDRSDWGAMGDQFRTLIRRYRDLPCHFVVTALERQDDIKLDSGEEVQQWGPALIPSLAGDVLGYVDLAIRTTADEVGGETEFAGYTRQTRQVRAKDRFGITPKRFVNPTFDRVLGYVREELTEGSDPVQSESAQRHSDAAAAELVAAEEKAAAKVAARAALRAAK